MGRERDTTDSVTIEEPDGYESGRELDSQGRFYIGRDDAKRPVRIVWKFLDEPEREDGDPDDG